MAFLDKTKANYAFKSILGKTHTSNAREAGNEGIASGITLSANRIFADPINSDPESALNAGIVSDQLTLELEPVVGSDTFVVGRYQAWRCKLGDTVPASLVGITNPVTGLAFAANDYVGAIIPQSFGQNFRPILYSDTALTNEVPGLDSSDWFLDPFAGVIVQEGYDDGTPLTFGTNGRLVCYVYIGSYVSDLLGASGLIGGGGATGWQKSVDGFTDSFAASTSGAVLLSPDLDLADGQSIVVVDGLRVVNLGDPATGQPIYDPNTGATTLGTVPTNAIVEWFSGPDRGLQAPATGYDQEGWVVTTPADGTFIANKTTGSSNINTLFRFEDGVWQQQTFEKTIPREIELVPTASTEDIDAWQILAPFSVTNRPTVDELDVKVNGISIIDKGTTKGVSWANYSTVTTVAITDGGTTDADGNITITLTTPGDLAVGNSIVSTVGGIQYYGNVLTIDGATANLHLVGINSGTNAIAPAAAGVTLTTVNRIDNLTAFDSYQDALNFDELSTFVLIAWHSANANFGIEADDSVTVEYYTYETAGIV